MKQITFHDIVLKGFLKFLLEFQSRFTILFVSYKHVISTGHRLSIMRIILKITNLGTNGDTVVLMQLAVEI